MFEFLALITGGKYWLFHSLMIKGVLKCYGIRAGKNFHIQGVPHLKIRGRGRDIIIGNNVSILGPIDLRNRERGKIVIEDDVYIDEHCRLVAANDATLHIGQRSQLGSYCIINCGVDVTIGKDCLIASMVIIQSSEHGHARGQLVREQKHTYGEIDIGDDVWIAAQALIMKGVTLHDGCVVAAKALVRKGEYEQNSVLAGIPAKKIRERYKNEILSKVHIA